MVLELQLGNDLKMLGTFDCIPDTGWLIPTEVGSHMMSYVQEVYSRLATAPCFPVMFSLVLPVVHYSQARRFDSKPHYITAKTIASIRGAVMSCHAFQASLVLRSCNVLMDKRFWNWNLLTFFNARSTMGWKSCRQITLLRDIPT